MYFLENWYKFVLAVLLIGGYQAASSYYFNQTQTQKTEAALKQLNAHSTESQEEIRNTTVMENNLYVWGWAGVGLAVFLIFIGDMRRCMKPYMPYLGVLLLLPLMGCYRPFPVPKLEVIAPNEEAFLIPYTGDTDKQTATNNEEYLKKNLVPSKQIQIPQQWVAKGYEWMGPNGEWRDAALLIKVDKQPVNREWTADPNSGTGTKNEAVWVMTSDQVEFSTGWVCTARIASTEDAIKFLHNYPNGSLTKILDTEVRNKLQTEFGLEVTDLPMDTLRKAATPHITKTVNSVTSFFKERGVTITNLGISGGFIYKDKSIADMMVKVFNSEQDKSIAIAETQAQEERNKKVVFEASGKADAILKTKKAEADGIKMVADAKFYEIEKAKADMQQYIQLKKLELEKELILKWDGVYPRTYFGSQHPNMLLQMPAIEGDKK